MCKVLYADDQQKKYKILLKNGQTYFSRCFVRKNNSRGRGLSSDEMEEALAFAREKGIDRKDIKDISVVFDNIQENYVSISQHALDRLKERLGWNKKTSIRMVEKVIAEGTKDRDVKGYLSSWVRSKMESDGFKDGHFMIYGKNAFIFHGNVLVTAYNVPKSETYRKQDKRFRRSDDSRSFRKQLEAYGY